MQKSSKRRYPLEANFKISLIISGLVILLPMWGGYLAFNNGNTSRLFTIFLGNWISPLICWLFAATLLNILQKAKLLKTESQATEALAALFVSCRREDQELNQETVDKLGSAFLAAQPQSSPDNLLLGRLKQNLENHNSAAEFAATMRDTEAAMMEGSFAMPRFAIWAIPILGFIGTVWGISGAVSSFSAAMNGQSSAAGISETLRENLPLVTANLATAFDTTFVALLLSLPLMYLITIIEKNEAAYLNSIAEIWTLNVADLTSAPAQIMTLKAPAAPASSPTGEETNNVAAELAALNLQIEALNHAMRDASDLFFAKHEGLTGQRDNN